MQRKRELLNFALTKGNVDDRNPDVINVITKDLFGKLYADKGYIGKKLFEMLFDQDVHLVTGIRSNMKNSLMSFRDKILLRKRFVIECINDELKNICHIEHSRHCLRIADRFGKVLFHTSDIRKNILRLIFVVFPWESCLE